MFVGMIEVRKYSYYRECGNHGIEVRKYSYYRECGTKNICNVGVDCFSRQGNISGHWQGPSYDSLNDVGSPGWLFMNHQQLLEPYIFLWVLTTLSF